MTAARHGLPIMVATPASWVHAACERWPLLLADHANCEKKAASTAIALMFAYTDDRRLAMRLSRLAREELRHFEQVDRLMAQLEVPPQRLPAGRYAAGLRAALRSSEPARKLDQLLCGALIEARSCERFGVLTGGAGGPEAPRLPAPVAALYAGLQASEARHFEFYLQAAQQHAEAAGGDWQARLAALAAVEAELATSPDPEFRFHSGPPPAAI
ncbi:MAG: tRNA isopentenyl-2-thiomethyl-A-37 hydroxylase MiaE [Steroidobacteraceae bacterium]|nr:tRNA-(ms[2]io[6]A)-hydroxylase [Nevskiaceae bacterium]MCP5339568.1 tRNA-(ms[2]io[6]A)-hydroxylase [Nevskiaceae bacterium]MCP5359140.1 tRNA-(ms[2]io[6]A)-hydroxylase [Nevskiaceae bacterium]MCP5466374.1 tRNA-(ms[2]io[6]A)-hydroxylase [Nevskiaceae bacterium]